EMYEEHPGAKVLASAATGYGEDLVKNAFRLDFGIVETVAHMKAAKLFMPDVDFIIDIGGQDMKCLKLKNGVIDNIHLNEACSSGCGSFIQTFAEALGYDVREFAKLGLEAQRPVDLGSRCTVFMNSSVKQAQKDGATTADISAGLSISVVKNALYKVIRAPGPEALGEHIVAQGGTFLNDAVLRAFETELGKDVVRPDIAAVMGAYGAAAHAREKAKGESTTLDAQALKSFTHKAVASTCKGCQNNCRLTINTFSDGGRYISGNRCSKPLGRDAEDAGLNMFKRKLALVAGDGHATGLRPVIGIPLTLNMYELAPFWKAFFERMGFEAVISPPSSRKTYLSGQSTVPSDTVCFPAKLAHGHIRALCDMGIKTIFYPCMSYNVDEGLGDKNYNCPVVAYYPEVIANNMDLGDVDFISCYAGIHKPRQLPVKLHSALHSHRGFEGISLELFERAVKAGFEAYEGHM
ncbi:MAG: acyl-CoA dehydratase activase-related protein, partial [Clostridia bacterium]|nr:acyl-CoA dehydratase activase-related protein [Clostridia bacterium]